MPSISVVIPTVGRLGVTGAIRSVREQDYGGKVEIIVVNDSSKSTETWPLSVGEADLIVHTGGGRGAGAARNLGAATASGQLIAYLDDDDVWLPPKLRMQVDLLLSHDPRREVVVACRFVESNGRDRSARAIPDRTIEVHERIEDYLFRARPVRVGRPSAITSSLLCKRSLALAVPWREDLRRHQDWDWLCRAQAAAGAHIVHHPEVLLTYSVSDAGSISSSVDWQSSLEWAMGWGPDWRAQTLADFVAGYPLRYAVEARSLVGARECFRTFVRLRRLPNIGPILLGFSGVFSRRTFNAARFCRKKARG